MDRADCAKLLGFDPDPVFPAPIEAGADASTMGQSAGDIASESVQVGANVAAQYGIQVPTDIPSAAQAAYGQLPASVQTVVRSGIQTYGQITPAIQLAQTISSGGVVDPQMAIAAVSAAATVFGGPIAGAVIGTAGEALQLASSAIQGLFDSLGLYDHPPTVQYCGLIPSASVPAGPSDPQFVHFTTPNDLEQFYNHLAGLDINAQTAPGTWTLYNYLQWALGYTNANNPSACPSNYPGCPGVLAALGYSLNDFDRYFASILRPNLESWANCNPYLPPRQLLHACATIWNSQHDASTTTTYQPIDWSQQGFAGTNLVSLILGNAGDPSFYLNNTGHRDSPLTVNLGPSTAPPPVGSHPGAGVAGAEAMASGQAGAAAAAPSSASAVPLVLGGTALAAGGLWLALGRPLSIEAAKAAFGRLFR